MYGDEKKGINKKILLIVGAILIVAIIVVLIIFLTGSKLEGTWINQLDRNSGYVFKSGGKGESVYFNSTTEFEYETNKDQLIFTYNNGTVDKYTYKIDDGRLVIKNQNGSINVFVRKK